jgi:hypothetical protein
VMLFGQLSSSEAQISVLRCQMADRPSGFALSHHALTVLRIDRCQQSFKSKGDGCCFALPPAARIGMPGPLDAFSEPLGAPPSGYEVPYRIQSEIFAHTGSGAAVVLALLDIEIDVIGRGA